MQYKLFRYITYILIYSTFLTSFYAKSIDIEELNQFQNSHFEQINKLCEDKDISIKETCFLLNSAFLIKSLNIIQEKNGINYFNDCYNIHYNEDKLKSYQFIYECVDSYKNLITYPFLNREYNYIFLEEENIFLNITNNCVNNRDKNKDINNCIRQQKESFNFFKVNFFNEINHSKEDVFRVCLKQNSFSKYNFDFKNINKCIKQNSF